jgi:hypothetical protein
MATAPAPARARGGARVLPPLRFERSREAGEEVWGFGKCRGASSSLRGGNGRGDFFCSRASLCGAHPFPLGDP